MPAPVTDTEKLIWSVLEAERPLIRFSWNVHFALSLSLSHSLLCSCMVVGKIKAKHLLLLVYSQLQEKSLVEANRNFLENHQGD